MTVREDVERLPKSFVDSIYDETVSPSPIGEDEVERLIAELGEAAEREGRSLDVESARQGIAIALASQPKPSKSGLRRSYSTSCFVVKKQLARAFVLQSKPSPVLGRWMVNSQAGLGRIGGTRAEVLGDSDDVFRAQHVGASEVAALFDASPYCTRFELWHRKAGNIATPEFGGNERIEWGIRLEPAIIQAAKDRFGYLERPQMPHLSNGRGLGGHPDRRVICPNRGPGILEVKTVDWLERKKWGDEPPLHYLLQDQAYQGLDGVSWGDVIVLVGGNSLERFTYDFRPALYAEIERRVADFWQSVETNDPPKPDFARDGDTLAEVLGEPTEEVADLRLDNHADELAAVFLQAKREANLAELRATEAKAELLMKIGSAGYAMLPNHRIGANQTKGSPGKVVTPEMVGETVGVRRGYRRFDVKETI